MKKGKQVMKMEIDEKGIEVEISAELTTALLMLSVLIVDLSEQQPALTVEGILDVLKETTEDVVNRKKKPESVMDELAKAALPLTEFLNKHGNPHSKVIVEQSRVDWLDGRMGIPFKVKD